MNRSGIYKKPVLVVENKYNDFYITKLINNLMVHGEKSIARSIVYTALDRLALRFPDFPVSELIQKIIAPIIPSSILRQKKIAGRKYSIPISVDASSDKPLKLSLKWFRKFMMNRPKKINISASDRLYNEMVSIILKSSDSVVLKYKAAHDDNIKANEIYKHYI